MSDCSTTPFPIHTSDNRYLILDINVIPILREKYRILGHMLGTLPQIPQQNVFLGLPMQLLPEEAKLLVDQGAAYLVDSKEVYRDWYKSLGEEEKEKILEERKHAEVMDGERRKQEADERKRKFWEKKRLDDLKKQGGETSLEGGSGSETPTVSERPETPIQTEYVVAAPKPPSGSTEVPNVPETYPLFKYLHEKEYYLSSGLRFGANYVAYPGDPARFHSHFCVNSKQFDEEFSMIDIVGGGRLGGGVKKGWLLGGVENTDESGKDNVRAFCVEWGGF
ncbi:tRNA-intron endonuclease catalytic domain-like protein [Ascobolus immersus RN42]|uniref:tRNA-splicing endonuclease subunit Sen34 n=1 Tax=Ascobolus immersus RN42 TaxID=1160509 RepID=A0A3N4IC22_ASCIM|nr:tRNA-intron endonuclease catalytic domain-like protein [Ascobolus immersus RN42]